LAQNYKKRINRGYWRFVAKIKILPDLLNNLLKKLSSQNRNFLIQAVSKEEKVGENLGFTSRMPLI
jgi:hypothetical protein